jgi:hypothetical protein
MESKPTDPLPLLLDSILGARRREEVFATIELPEMIPAPEGRVSRAQLSMALALVLFEDVCRRVTMAQAYVTDLRLAGRRLLFDHGALRTVAAPSGELPAGRAALARILEPLGYHHAGTCPLERLALTGYVYTHEDLPAGIPQYFVSEFHPERFSPAFQAAVGRVIETSRDPLSPVAGELLEELTAKGSLDLEGAARLLPEMVACFDRHHEIPTLADHEILAAESQEMAWIATEGQAFNHATDRVDDVVAVADRQRELGRPIKDRVEVSASGRVLQTAFRAQPVERLFRDAENRVVVRTVPGSFHELITRKTHETGELDLAFDASNAQGIFVMTRPEEV